MVHDVRREKPRERTSDGDYRITLCGHHCFQPHEGGHDGLVRDLDGVGPEKTIFLFQREFCVSTGLCLGRCGDAPVVDVQINGRPFTAGGVKSLHDLERFIRLKINELADEEQ